MYRFVEIKGMKSKRYYLSDMSKFLLFLVIVFSITMMTGFASAKSLYLLSDIDAYPNPIQTYDIGSDGSLTFQEQHNLPRYNNGTRGLALDSDSGYLFITYAGWGRIILVNSETMIPLTEMVSVPGAWDLSGIVYNHKKKQLYCVDRARKYLWAYEWKAETKQLTLVDGAPFKLSYATAYGLALDEVDQLLYVTNSTDRVMFIVQRIGH